MHLLPLTLGKLADQTDKRDSTRFALSGVHLMVGRSQGANGANTFTAEVTDSKQLIRVSGPCSGQAVEYPEHPGLATAPNGAFEALIPAETWRRAFVTAVKTTRKAKHKAAVLQSVAVKVGENVTTFAATDLDAYPVEQTRNMEGKYPPVNDILRQTRKSAKFVFAADPKILAGVLETLATFTEAGAGRVEFHVGTPDKPLYIKAINPDGLNVESVVMPLLPEKGQDDGPDEAEDAAAVAASDEWSKQLNEARAERDAIAAERDALARDMAHLREEMRRTRGQAVPPAVVTSGMVQPMSRRERIALKA